MTNTNPYSASGFTPTRMVDGSPLDYQVRLAIIQASDGTATFIGDAVVFDTGTYTNNATGYPLVKQAAASATEWAGIVVGVEPITGVTPGLENLYQLHRPASTLRLVRLCDDPRVVFECVANNQVTAPQLQSKNADIVVGSGNTYSGISAMQVDTGTIATTATLPLKFYGASQRVGNIPANTGALIEVTLNNVRGKQVLGY